ncbi:MAG: hypothetical protein IPK76_09105 [Lewinellaceae bacterium]|nr:hypothetical protein [Lewinellaceae bacterium]
MSKTQKKTKVAQTQSKSVTHGPVDDRPPGGIKLGPCETAAANVEAYFNELALSKVNQLSPCDEDKGGCPCHSGGGSGSTSPKVDLIVLIDTSGSMENTAVAVSNAVVEAIALAKSECNTDLEITYLGVEGTWPGTVFLTNHRDYIVTHNGTVPLVADDPYVGYQPEQGANAVEDLSKYAKWREGACRSIFYISDEELDSISPTGDFANETLATNNAIAAANLNDVTVFAHHLTYQGRGPNIEQNYQDLCDQTGGMAYFSVNTPSMEEYVKMLKEIICDACGSGCKEAEFPDLAPCISVAWGDSDCDCMETNDFEVLAITVCNCYSNVSFGNLSIGQIIVTDALGNPVALLPDGSPSVEIHPPGALCFGTLGPCTDDTPSCVTREIVVYTRGAIAGKYLLKFEGVCYSIAYTGNSEACFAFNLCKD